MAATAAAPGEGPDGYRAPEQDRPLRHPIGSWTDVFQLAAIVYHLSTGYLPGHRPLPPSTLRPGLSSRFDDVLLPALREEANQRPDAGRFFGDLSGLVGQS